MSNMSNLNELILKRKTIKRYQTGIKIEKKQLIEIVEAGRMAPSGFGLQQVEVLVFSNQAKKDEVAEAFQGYNCDNIKSASALIVVLGIETETYKEDDGALMDQKLFDHANLPNEKYLELKKHLLNIYPKIEFKSEYDKINAGIHVGYMALKATELGLGTTIMTGFYVDKLTETLKKMNLLKKGRRPVFGLAVGVADPNYEGNNREKIRVKLTEYADFLD